MNNHCHLRIKQTIIESLKPFVFITNNVHDGGKLPKLLEILSNVVCKDNYNIANTFKELSMFRVFCFHFFQLMPGWVSKELQFSCTTNPHTCETSMLFLCDMSTTLMNCYEGFFFSIKTQNGFAWPNSILSLLIFNLYPSVRILHKLEHPLDSCQQMNVKETNSNIIHQVAELHVIHYWRKIFPLGSECHLRKIYKFTLIDYRGF